MDMPTDEQVKTTVRWFVSVFGGGLAGYFAGKGWASTDQILDALNSPAFMSFMVTTIPLIWGVVARTRKNIVLAANRLPEVAGVITTQTDAGVKLANSVPGETVVPAGTMQAKSIAANPV